MKKKNLPLLKDITITGIAAEGKALTRTPKYIQILSEKVWPAGRKIKQARRSLNPFGPVLFSLSFSA